MGRLSALLPVPQSIACYAALKRHADQILGAGDERGHGQIMADTLVERLTGQARAAAVPVEINLVMTDMTLFGGSDPVDAAASSGTDTPTPRPSVEEPAHLDGYGTVPAGWARDLALSGAPDTPRWLRRLCRDPNSGELAAMDSRRRSFIAGQQLFIKLRDHWCRTPWCEAPIRHIDHIRPVEHGGATHVRNGRGTCAACNYARQAAGWHAKAGPSGAVILATPTGHAYRSHPPRAPGARKNETRGPDEQAGAELRIA